MILHALDHTEPSEANKDIREACLNSAHYFLVYTLFVHSLGFVHIYCRSLRSWSSGWHSTGHAWCERSIVCWGSDHARRGGIKHSRHSALPPLCYIDGGRNRSWCLLCPKLQAQLNHFCKKICSRDGSWDCRNRSRYDHLCLSRKLCNSRNQLDRILLCPPWPVCGDTCCRIPPASKHQRLPEQRQERPGVHQVQQRWRNREGAVRAVQEFGTSFRRGFALYKDTGFRLYSITVMFYSFGGYFPLVFVVGHAINFTSPLTILPKLHATLCPAYSFHKQYPVATSL